MYINDAAVLQLDQPCQVILGGNGKVEKETKKKKTPEMHMCLIESQGGGRCFRLLGNIHIKFKYLVRERERLKKRKKRCFYKGNSVWAFLFEHEVVMPEFCSALSDWHVF